VQAGPFETIDRAVHRELSPLGAGPDGRGRAAPLRLVGDTLESLREPAAPGVTLLLAGAACWHLRRRGRGGTAALWAGAFASAFAIEAALKVVVDQRMPGIPREVTGLGMVSPGSYPSGHVARAVLLAGLGAALWPRSRRWLVGWAVLVAVAIMLLGMHLASDVAGGAVLGTALVLAVNATSAGRVPPREPAGPSRPRPVARTPAGLATCDPAATAIRPVAVDPRNGAV
jgi:undecaprenyl-diphosphatase